MKKFLIFLVSLVIVVCLGLTTFYFVRNNEIITIKTKELYCNAGDIIPIKSLGIDIKKANVSKKTQFNYNAAGEEVEKSICYDETSSAYVVSSESAGEITLEISTTNKKYSNFTIKVHVGNGSVENPYYIFTESDLMKIGSIYKLDKSYILMNDITLTNNFSPIGYNVNTQTWDGFNGIFNGQGYSIKGLNLNNIETSSVGLFSTLGANSIVKNLTITNATISGNYENVGVLAGTIKGTVEKVAIKNSSINNGTNGTVGALAGVYSGSTLKLAYADNVNISVGEDSTASIVGGLVGKLNETTVQAVYTNNVTIQTTDAQAAVGGLIGEMIISENAGSIQQSYANTNSIGSNYGAFIGKISEKSGFNINNGNMLKHLIGNIAVVYGKENSADIVDSDLVKVYNNEIFKKMEETDQSVFYMPENALYLVRGFVSAGEVIATNEFVFYAVDVNTITNWDTTYVWDTSKNTLPLLKLGNIYPTAPSSDYFRRDFEQKEIGNKNTFVQTFSSNVEDKKIKLLEDVDLSNGWTPVAVKNTTIDGNNKTITINLNNAINSNLGLFTTIDNCTIKNLNIVITNISANAENAGALAGVITSTDSLTSSQIENVKITYNGFATPTITNFGGIAGKVENTNILDSSIVNLTVNSEAQIKNSGAITAESKNSTISNSSILNSTIMATNNAGGVVATNNGTITNVTGIVYVNVAGANAGGVVATNNGTINNVKLTVDISVKQTKAYQNIGGVAGVNAGAISDVEVVGEKISIDVQDNNLINIGGVVATNDGTIINVNNSIASIGTYYVGSNHYVGGVAAVNSGSIKQVATQSNLNGNYVAGVVVTMNKASAVIDQVVVGKYNAVIGMLSENTMMADKYIAGIVVNFKLGIITNIQASSEIKGGLNATRSSLVALIFPYGVTLKNATINSSFSGYGEKYREVWTDFASYSNKAEFGLSSVQGIDGRFNLYLQNSHHGMMQSVVINGANAGVTDAKASMGSAFLWGKDYDDNEESSFVKVVTGFYSPAQFQGSYEFVCAISSVFGIQHKVTRTLTFDVGSVWETGYGINLAFVKDLIKA